MCVVGLLPFRIHPLQVFIEAGLVTLADVYLEGLDVLLEESLNCLRPNPRDLFPAVFNVFRRLALARPARSSLLDLFLSVHVA